MSSLGPNATTIRVPYKPENHSVVEKKKIKKDHNGKHVKKYQTLGEETRESGNMNLREDIENLRKRLASIDGNTTTITRDNKDATKRKNDTNKQHFDYKTIVANVKAAPLIPRQQVVDSYNVRVIEHNSPFNNQQHQPAKSVNELSDSIARLELLSSSENSNREQHVASGTNKSDNNNEANFELSEFIKYKKPINFETDNISLVSSCSLRSSRTYDVRTTGDVDLDNQDQIDDHLDDERHFPIECQNFDSTSRELDNTETSAEDSNQNEPSREQEDEDGKKPAAWLYDLRDGSSTAILAPPKPKKVESPKIDAKTEELGESRGGKSYYLELIEPEKQKQRQQQQLQAQQFIKRRPRPSSIDSLYSRWNSHSTLSGSSNNRSSNQQHNSTPDKCPSISILNTKDTRKSRQIMPASILDLNGKPIYSTNSINNNNSTQQPIRRQLPFAGPTLNNRSKSSSCLIGSTRQSKYSIYGGLRKPNNDNKPVPRLSYSRAIGPKSQRQIDAQPKAPSRYLKMK